MQIADKFNPGKFLQRVRTSKHMQLRELAILSGLNSGQISRIENGHSKPTLFALVQLCYGLSITLEDILQQMQLDFKDHQAQPPKTEHQVLNIQDVLTFCHRAIQNSSYGLDLFSQFTLYFRELNSSDSVLEAVRIFDYPAEITPELLRDTYQQGGVVTIQEMAI